MDADIKQEWVRRLRSGDYKQGMAYLRRTDDTYCCLGVLCEIAVEQNVIPEPTNTNSFLEDSYYAYGVGNTGVLPKVVMAWAGLDDSVPDVYIPEFGRVSLAGLNDGEGYTFDQIADVIDNQL